MGNTLVFYLVIINIFTLITYGIDKIKAIWNKWRIKESVLLGMAVIGGSVGALAGMYLFRHKTQKKKFYILVPFILIIHMVILYFVLR